MAKQLIISACALIVLAFGVAAADAQGVDPHRRTFVTISEPVTVQGVTLAPGTYLVRYVHDNSYRKLVQVLSADEKEHYGVFLSQPAYRNEGTPNPLLRLAEAPSDEARPARTWYPRGELMGSDLMRSDR